MTRDPREFGRRKTDGPPPSFGRRQFSFMAMAGAIGCCAWAVMTYQGIAFVFTIILFALATMTVPEDRRKS